MHRCSASINLYSRRPYCSLSSTPYRFRDASCDAATVPCSYKSLRSCRDVIGKNLYSSPVIAIQRLLEISNLALRRVDGHLQSEPVYTVVCLWCFNLCLLLLGGCKWIVYICTTRMFVRCCKASQSSKLFGGPLPVAGGPQRQLFKLSSLRLRVNWSGGPLTRGLVCPTFVREFVRKHRAKAKRRKMRN